jgi:hypothetical protein
VCPELFPGLVGSAGQSFVGVQETGTAEEVGDGAAKEVGGGDWCVLTRKTTRVRWPLCHGLTGLVAAAGPALMLSDPLRSADERLCARRYSNWLPRKARL